jgi:hypothetical protein
MATKLKEAAHYCALNLQIMFVVHYLYWLGYPFIFARIFQLFIGIDSKESILPAHVAWHAGTTVLFLLYTIVFKFQHSPIWFFKVPHN